MGHEPVLQHALGLGEEGRWDDMAALLGDALETDPDDPYLLCWLGVAEREAGRNGSAYEVFKRCVAQDPIDPQLLALAGSGLAAFDDPDAERVLRAAALTGPTIPMARLHYGAFLARAGMFDAGIEQLRAAADLDPEDAATHGELGNAFALKGDWDAAEDAFADALGLAPDDSWTRVLLGLVLVERKDIEGAATVLLEAAAERPDDAEAQVLAALAAGAAGWEAPALEALARTAFSAEPIDSGLYDEVDGALARGPVDARALLVDDLAPSALRERLHQPL